MNKTLRILALALVLLAGRAAATLLTGTVLSPGGSPVTGTLYLQLSQSANLNAGPCGGPAAVANIPPFIFNLVNGQIAGPGIGPYQVPGADCLTPAGLTYHMTVTGPSGGTVLEKNVSISGTTVDLGTLTPVTPPGPPTPGLQLAGDVTGPATLNTVSKLQSRALSVTSPSDGQVIGYSLSLNRWQPVTIPGLGVVAVNLVFAGPTAGPPALPTFRALSAADITLGILPVARGGTGDDEVEANKLFGGPGTGADAPPSFRSMVIADLPDLSNHVVLLQPGPAHSTQTGIADVGDIYFASLQSSAIFPPSLFLASPTAGGQAAFRAIDPLDLPGGLVAGSLTTTEDNTTNATMYPLFQAAVSGSNPVFTSSISALTYKPDTGRLGASIMSAVTALFTNTTTTNFTFGAGTGVVHTTAGVGSTSSVVGADFANQTANLVFAGPGSGGAAAPGFRALVAADHGTGTANTTTFLRGDLTWTNILTGRLGLNGINPTAILDTSSSTQSAAAVSGRAVVGGNAFEWGHSNPAGYGSTLGYNTTNGNPYLAFNGEAGTTGDTYKTRGIKASIIRSDLAGGIQIGNAATASADNQALTLVMAIPATGAVTLTGSLAATGRVDADNTIGWFNAVNGYGASTGGTAAANTTAINAAITAANAAGGGIVYVPAGSYNTNGITLLQNVTLQGDGMFATTITSSAAVDVVTIDGSAYASNDTQVHVRDIQISATGSATRAVYIKNAVFTMFDRVRAVGGTTDAVKIDSTNGSACFHNQFNQCWVGNAPNGIHVGGFQTTGVVLIDCEIVGTSAGLLADSSEGYNVSAYGSIFEGSTGPGAKIEGNATSVSTDSPLIFNATDSYFESNTTADIDINPSGGASGLPAVSISGGSLVGTTARGIRMNAKTKLLRVAGVSSVFHGTADIDLGDLSTTSAIISIQGNSLRSATKILSSNPTVAGSNFPVGFTIIPCRPGAFQQAGNPTTSSSWAVASLNHYMVFPGTRAFPPGAVFTLVAQMNVSNVATNAGYRLASVGSGTVYGTVLINTLAGTLGTAVLTNLPATRTLIEEQFSSSDNVNTATIYHAHVEVTW